MSKKCLASVKYKNEWKIKGTLVEKIYMYILPLKEPWTTVMEKLCIVTKSELPLAEQKIVRRPLPPVMYWRASQLPTPHRIATAPALSHRRIKQHTGTEHNKLNDKKKRRKKLASFNEVTTLSTFTVKCLFSLLLFCRNAD